MSDFQELWNEKPWWKEGTTDKEMAEFYYKKGLETQKEPSAQSPAAMAGYVADLEAFMMIVSNKLKCLPSFADPHPNEGNEHVIKKLDELLDRAT